MNNERLLSQIVDLMDGSEKKTFETSIEIKLSPHYHLCSIWGVMVGNKKDVWLMDGQGQWFVLKANDTHAREVAGSVLQRLKVLQMGIRV